MTPLTVKDRLLDEAQALVQSHGYNGFSYRDLSVKVGISTASIHYHFPSKTDLSVALVKRYREAFSAALGAVAARSNELGSRLEGVAAVFAESLARDRVCLCGAMAGEFQSLPDTVKRELQRFIQTSEGWLARFFAEAIARGEVSASQDPEALAKLWFASLQGALLTARATEHLTLDAVVAALKALTLLPMSPETRPRG